MNSDRLTFDSRQSVRSIDTNGFMHIAISPLTKEQIAPYYGREIPGWESLGLDPNKTYMGYRPAEELKKPETIASFNGIPLQFRHHADFAEAPAKDTRVGAVGTEAKWASPYLMNSLVIYDQKAQKVVKNGFMRELSSAYKYKPDFTPGTWNGQRYDFIMRDIRANHVALVEEGRAGADVLVYDSKNGRLRMGDENKKAAELALVQALLALHQEEAANDIEGAVDQIIADVGESLDEEKRGRLKKAILALGSKFGKDACKDAQPEPEVTVKGNNDKVKITDNDDDDDLDDGNDYDSDNDTGGDFDDGDNDDNTGRDFDDDDDIDDGDDDFQDEGRAPEGDRPYAGEKQPDDDDDYGIDQEPDDIDVEVGTKGKKADINVEAQAPAPQKQQALPVKKPIQQQKVATKQPAPQPQKQQIQNQGTGGAPVAGGNLPAKQETNGGDQMASLINYALKACGLEKEDPEVQQAFIAGLKYGNQGDGAGQEMASDSAYEDDGNQLTIADITAQVRQSINEINAAANDVKSVLGKVQVDAYDSADDVYYDACIELGIECTKETARDSYNAYKSALKSNAQMATDGAQKKTILSTMLDDVNIGY